MSGKSKRLPKRVRPGDLTALQRKVWRALQASEQLLEHEDPQTRLRAVHATSQAAACYRAIYSDAELESRIVALEQRAEKGAL